MAKFKVLLQFDDGMKAMQEDGLNAETIRVLVEFS